MGQIRIKNQREDDMTDVIERTYLTYTFLKKKHGLSINALKQLLASEGLLLNDHPTQTALSSGAAKMFPLQEGAPYGSSRKEFVKWDRDTVAEIVTRRGAGKDPRAKVHGKYDLIRCTKAFSVEALRSVGLSADTIYEESAASKLKDCVEDFSYLLDWGMRLTMDVSQRDFDKVVRSLDNASEWLRKKRKVDEEKRALALEIADGIREWISKQ